MNTSDGQLKSDGGDAAKREELPLLYLNPARLT